MSLKTKDFIEKMKYCLSSHREYEIVDIKEFEVYGEERVVVIMKPRLKKHGNQLDICYFSNGDNSFIKLSSMPLISEDKILLINRMFQRINDSINPITCFLKKWNNECYSTEYITFLFDVSEKMDSFSVDVFNRTLEKFINYVDVVENRVGIILFGAIDEDNIELETDLLLEKLFF